MVTFKRIFEVQYLKQTAGCADFIDVSDRIIFLRQIDNLLYFPDLQEDNLKKEHRTSHEDALGQPSSSLEEKGEDCSLSKHKD